MRGTEQRTDRGERPTQDVGSTSGYIQEKLHGLTEEGRIQYNKRRRRQGRTEIFNRIWKRP